MSRVLLDYMLMRSGLRPVPYQNEETLPYFFFVSPGEFEEQIRSVYLRHSSANYSRDSLPALLVNPLANSSASSASVSYP